MLTTGCLATRGYVDTQMTDSQVRTDERVDGLETQVEENQTRIEEQAVQIEDHAKRLDEMSDTAREALGRAISAGKLAEGKQVHAILDQLASALVEEDGNVYLEIQGHTDSTGSDAYNRMLGERRAEAVRAYLNGEHAIPLHRISVISYGESRPIADNSTADGRAQNRRVTVVVLK